MEWYLTLPAVFCKRNTKWNLSLCYISAIMRSHTHNREIQKHNCNAPTESKTLVGILSEHRQVIIPENLLFKQNQQKFSTVYEENNTCVFKLIWVFCFKGQE